MTVCGRSTPSKCSCKRTFGRLCNNFLSSFMGPQFSAGTSFQADVFVPNFRIRADILAQQESTLFGIKVDDLDSRRTQPLDATQEVPALADDHSAETKLSHQTAAIPAGR